METECLPMPDRAGTLTMIASAGGFDIVPLDGGYRLLDTDDFNRWMSVTKVLFRTEDLAANYAWSCNNFKCGRTMTLSEPVTGY